MSQNLISDNLRFCMSIEPFKKKKKKTFKYLTKHKNVFEHFFKIILRYMPLNQELCLSSPIHYHTMQLI